MLSILYFNQFLFFNYYYFLKNFKQCLIKNIMSIRVMCEGDYTVA